MARPAGEHPGLAGLVRRSRATLRDRVHRLRVSVWLALQVGIAAGLAWFVARDLVGHPEPFFAPIAAVVTLAVSFGQRLRRAVELVVGVAVGIAVGDLLIAWIGTGAGQIALVVSLAMLLAVFLGSGTALVTQAATSAVLVAALTPPGGSFPRFVDALVGGLVGLVVMALLLPINPLTLVRRATTPVLDMVARGLRETSAALATRDQTRAEAVLSELRAGEEDLNRFREALEAARESARLAPLRWRVRGALAQYVHGANQVGYALRNTRVLIRRAIRVTADEEPVPEGLPEAVMLLGEAVEWLGRELAGGEEPEACRGRALTAVSEAARAYANGVGFSGSVVVAQIRSIGIDLVRATGLSRTEARELVRRAASP